MDSTIFNAPTISDNDVTQVPITDANNLTISGAPIAGGTTGTAITNSTALRINAAAVNTGSGAVTNAYGLYVSAPTGATNNYAATFATGSVGIGTAAPTAALHVFGDVNTDRTIKLEGNNARVDITRGSTTNSGAMRLFTGSTLYWFVGMINTNNQFQIVPLDGGTSALTMRYEDTLSGISLITLGPGNAPTFASAATAEFTTLTVTPPTITLTGGTQVTSQMDSILINAPTITDTTAITVDKAATLTIAGNPTAAGSVTITAPRALDVNGRVEINLAGTQTSVALCGSHAAGGGASVSDVEIVDCTGTPSADYMEMYPVEQGVEPGYLVMPGSEYTVTTNGKRIAKLVKTASSYQRAMMGIVSDPSNAGDFNSIGYNIKKEDNPKPIALNGRVQVKVSLENGPIAAGDTITSSSTPGVAMKATKPGRVIGIALEGFDGNNTTSEESRCATSAVKCGKIMVFVNPHWSIGTVEIAADGNDPLFKDLSDKVSLLETKINELAASASTSALLQEIGEIGQIGKAIDIETATVSGTLAVLGRTTVADLGVTGNISAGLLYINGLDTSLAESNAKATINSVGDLYLQNNQLGGITYWQEKLLLTQKAI